MLGGHRQNVERGARPLHPLHVLDILPAQQQRLEPADTPVQLPEHGTQRRAGPVGDI